ncbi:MAG: amidohydrolase family protein [Actinomycetota bacterium]
MAHDDDDPGLPIKLGPCSNGEYDPVPLTPALREFVRRARELCDATARRLGMSRRQFLRSACGAATSLLVLDACSRDEASDAGRSPGGSFDVPTTATTEPEAAAEIVGGEEFVFDVQSHLLEYDLNRAMEGANFWRAFPQQDCGENDPRLCFSMDHYMQSVFLESDTSMAVLSALPIVPEGSPLSPEVMLETKDLTVALCQDERILLHSLATPNVGSIDGALAAMEVAAAEHDVAAWKCYTHFAPGARPWRLDDGDPSLPQVAEPFLAKAADLGITIVCTHKGLGGEPFSSPADIGPAAARHPEISFVAYHSGYQAQRREGPYDEAQDHGINRLVTSMRRAGVGANANAYAELGSTWWLVMRDPEQAAHVLGKLLLHVGEDNVLWGTDSIWYGSPQDQIQAFRAFQISEEYQERFGYPALTEEIKAKVLGLNAARLYGVDPITDPCEFTREELEQIRRDLPGDQQVLGPRTASEVRQFNAFHQGWP